MNITQIKAEQRHAERLMESGIIITNMEQQPNYVDMADVCELAHILTLKECSEKGITMDRNEDDEETGYTTEAQSIYDYYHDTITNTLNV